MKKRLWSRPVLQWAMSVIIFFLFILLVEEQFGWRGVFSAWHFFLHPFFVLILFLILFNYIFRTIRLCDFFGFIRPVQWLPAVRLIVFHNVLNNILPMRSGELSFPVFMKSYFGISAGKSVPGLLWFRVLDLYVLSQAGLYLVLKPRLTTPALVAVLGISLLMALGVYPLRSFINSRADRIPSRFRNMVAGMAGALPERLVEGIRMLLWTILNWGTKLAAYGWILALIAETDLSTGLLGSVTGELSSVLPFHGFAGAGTYEAGVLASMLPMGVPAGRAVAAAVNLHLIILSVSLATALLALPFGRFTNTSRTDIFSCGRQTVNETIRTERI